MSPLQRRIRQSLWLILLATAAILGACALWLMMARSKNVVEMELRERLRSVAAVAAVQFDGADIERIRDRKDIPSDGYMRTLHRLRSIMDRTPNINSVYIMRRTNDPDRLAFVADASALLSAAELDTNKNGVVDSDEVAPLPGDPYDSRNIPAMKEAFLHPAVDKTFTTDQWGTTISGYAPIERADNGKIVAILGLDMNAADFVALSRGTSSIFFFALLLIASMFIIGSFVLLFLDRRMEILRRLERERAGLLLLTSHQLGQPLTIFKLSLEMLAEQIQSPELKKAVTEHIDHMNEGIYRMNNLLVLLKEAARVDDKTMEYRPERVRLGAIVASVRSQCGAPLQRKLQRLAVSMEEDADLYLDKTLIENALLQLLDNAMGFSPEGSIIALRAERKGKRVLIDIKDKGAGIPARDQHRIFEKFVRGENAAHYKPDGSGLGLFISKGIIERAGGEIRLKSKEGEGTIVTVSLPVAEGR
jgi:K+-sensing histidine kinase KdpD